MLRHTKRCQIWRTCSCLVLWAGAEYKAILSLALGLNLCPPELLEAITMADVWLDALSMLVVAPTMLAWAMVAWQQMPEGAWKQTAPRMVHCTFTSNQ